jgi:hypothetical protein
MPERSKWVYSKTQNRIFEICSWFTLVMIGLDVLGFVLGETLQQRIYIEHPGWLTWIGFGSLLLLCGVCVISQFLLWIGMMVWSAVWPGEWFVIRILLVLAQLVTLTIGSSLIYVFIYRKQHERAQKVMMARAGVTA